MSKNRKTDKDRKFLCLLYPDAEDYDCAEVLQKITTEFPFWAYALHDKDTDQETGEPKKPHFHVYLGTGKSPYQIKTIANKLGIDERYIEFCGRVRGSIRYLVHADDMEKHQYSVSDIVSNFNPRKYFEVREPDEMAMEILEYIMRCRPQNEIVLCQWCIMNNLYSEYRRNRSGWVNMINVALSGQIEKE